VGLGSNNTAQDDKDKADWEISLLSVRNREVHVIEQGEKRNWPLVRRGSRGEYGS